MFNVIKKATDTRTSRAEGLLTLTSLNRPRERSPATYRPPVAADFPVAESAPDPEPALPPSKCAEREGVYNSAERVKIHCRWTNQYLVQFCCRARPFSTHLSVPKHWASFCSGVFMGVVLTSGLVIFSTTLI